MQEPVINQPDGDIILFHPNGNTGDIINAIIEADPMGPKFITPQLVQALYSPDLLQTYRNVWQFVHGTIPYVEDPDGTQVIQLPGQLYNNRKKELGGTGKGGDCKSMALMASSILRAMNLYNFYYRFTSEVKSADYHHVYIIAEYDGCYICIDPTLKQFDQEAGFAKFYDMQPAMAEGCAIAGPRMGDAAPDEYNPYVSPTQAAMTQLDADKTGYWQKELDYYKNRIPFIAAQCLLSTKQGVAFHYGQTKPTGKCDASTTSVKCKAAIDAIQKNFSEFLKCGSALIYYYWNERTVAYYTCRRPNEAPADIPFPDSYAKKRLTSIEIHTAFKKLGMRDSDIRQICNIGTYKQYGVTMDYMLYRCYCITLYGQPFKPHWGVPYYDIRSGKIWSNGADINTTFLLAGTLPAQGGMGRPFGTPYWSVMGYIINNGASERQVTAWAQEPVNQRPGTVVNGVTIPGYIHPGFTQADQEQGIQIYNKWREGNMVVLPVGNTSTTRNRTGTNQQGTTRDRPGVGELATILGLVVGLATAIGTILGYVAKIVSDTKKTVKGSDIPIPPDDFKWERDTVDGCYIATPANSNVPNKHVKICGGVVVDNNPDLNAPENQSPDYSFFDLPPEKKKMLLVGAGLSIAGGSLLLLNQNKKSNAA
jgi:hypothetical protein